MAGGAGPADAVTLRVRLASGRLLVVDGLEPDTPLADVEVKLQEQLDAPLPPFYSVRLLRPGGGEASVAELVQSAAGTEIAAFVGLSEADVEAALREGLEEGRHVEAALTGCMFLYVSWDMDKVGALGKALLALDQAGYLNSRLCELLIDIVQAYALARSRGCICKISIEKHCTDILVKHGDLATAENLLDMVLRLGYPADDPFSILCTQAAEQIRQRHQREPSSSLPSERPASVEKHPADVEAAAPTFDGREGAAASTEEDDVAALQREGADLQEAILRSKADPRSADGVLVARVTFHSPEIISQILGSSAVADAVERVADAGCDVQPEWACGAILLVPLTEAQLYEAGVALKAHNIVMLQTDLGSVEEALRGLPRRRRPMLKPECHDQDSSSTQGAPGASAPTAEPETASFPKLVVENTFLAFPMDTMREVSETSATAQSDPGAGAACSRHHNPRRWA